MWQFTRTDWLKKFQQQHKNVIFDTTTFCNFYLILIADPCYNYQNLSDANRKSSYLTPTDGPSLCDNLLPKGWYRFVGAAGTEMPTTRVPAHRCGTDWSGWLNGAHPTVEDGEVKRKVCFNRFPANCKYSMYISVKNCGSYFIYKLQQPTICNLRYCGRDWMWSKCTRRSKMTHKLNCRYMCTRFWHVTSLTFLIHFKHYQKILTLVANRYLFP